MCRDYKVNEDIANQLKKDSNTQFSQNKRISMHVSNAIIVYEMSNAMMNILDMFDLTGKKELLNLKSEVFTDLNDFRKIQKKLKEDFAINPGSNEKSNIAAQKSLDNYDTVCVETEKAWHELTDQIMKMERQVLDVKKLKRDFEIKKKLAQQKIYLSKIIGPTKFAKELLELVSIPINAEEFELVDYSQKEVKGFYGFNVIE